MPNARLRNAMTAAEITSRGLAEAVGVDAKSVERWITKDRQPHPATRIKVAKLLGFEETYFWPALLGGEGASGATRAELVQFWARRNDVPPDVWRSLIEQTRDRMEILVYSGGFLVESFNLVDVIRAKSAEGVTVRLLLGDPASEAVRNRGKEEGLPTLPQRCQSTLEYLQEAVALPQVSIRVHSTPLYASQFRFDSSMLVNTHTYGSWAARSPVHHLQRVPSGQLFTYYSDTFDRVWATAKPVG
ncbi:hypothetical protein SAMN05216199_3838 [Pedococcus cremeus]|uniref:HTH cro/C1-type domain-containing protein n=1 Tax=Pedococcus cremeus TaxID=587636 RepID=A0A1H9XHS3_9MICO|nr:helix-turn-helix domain-containing protein [Pedococcus cremeus]SES45736.1 hypothetical protein SAMN05216199_3838 [Pedococcus cremeus]